MSSTLQSRADKNGTVLAHARYVFSQILDWPNLGPPQSGITTVVLFTKWHLKKKHEALLVNLFLLPVM